MFRFALVALIVVLPGGLLIATALVAAQVLAEALRREPKDEPHRFARAFATVKLRDVVQKARHLV